MGEYTILQEQKTDSVTFLENKLVHDLQIIHPTNLIDFQVLKLLIELIKLAIL